MALTQSAIDALLVPHPRISTCSLAASVLADVAKGLDAAASYAALRVAILALPSSDAQQAALLATVASELAYREHRTDRGGLPEGTQLQIAISQLAQARILARATAPLPVGGK